MQIVVDDAELARFRAAAADAGVNLSEWVRRALRDIELRRSPKSPEQRIAAIRAAAKHSYPAPEIEQMNAEIERGYLDG